MKTDPVLLRDAPFLAVDCQSTGATPASGSLVEIGWARAGARDVVAHVVELPDEEQLSPVIARITGLTAGDLSRAIAPADAWRGLRDACHASPTPTLIHFARFEERFLRALHDSVAPDEPFPLDIVCTHAIATRLLPRLPRRGLRALAGYFGMGVEPARRCADHVEATLFVWRHLVDLLDKIGVHTVHELRAWMSRPAPRRARPKKKRYPMSRAKRLHLPGGPGVYRMLRTNGDVLYVGKALSLRRRVNSYFQKQSRVGDRTLEMLSQARDVSVVETATGVEAALLECDEIKRCAPPYNRALVDRAERRAARGALRDVEIVELMRAVEDALPVEPGWAMRVGARLWSSPSPSPVSPSRRSAVPPFRRFVPVSRSAFALRVPGENSLAMPQEPETRSGDRQRRNGGIHSGETRSGGWPADELSRVLGDIVTRGARAVRLARWMCRLAESSVAWTIGGRSRNLVLEGGAIIERADRSVPAVPPGWKRPTRQRWGCFDLATYDRVRVLSTELRRLVDCADDVRVRFGPSELLDRERLARALSWV